MSAARSGKHYQFHFHGVKVDPYRIFLIYGITNPAQQHAIKKLLRAGSSNKSLVQDLQEARDSISRMLEMIEEDSTYENLVGTNIYAPASSKESQEVAQLDLWKQHPGTNEA